MTEQTDTQVRIERDSMGDRQILSSDYYGIQTLRAIENFPIGGNVFIFAQGILLGLR